MMQQQQQALFGALNSPTTAAAMGQASLQEGLTEMLSPLFQGSDASAGVVGGLPHVNSREEGIHPIVESGHQQQQQESSPTKWDISMKWHDASIMLGVEEDKLYLSGLQCLLRSEFVEAFGCKEVSTYISYGLVFVI